MKKKVFSAIGAGMIVGTLVLGLTLNTQKVHASTIEIINTKALNESSPGKCTGPKTQGTCGCSNGYSCSDSSGCNS